VRGPPGIFYFIIFAGDLKCPAVHPLALGRLVTRSEGIPCPAPTPNHTIYLSALIRRKNSKIQKISAITKLWSPVKNSQFLPQSLTYSSCPLPQKMIYFPIKGGIGCFF
jgi:hypothetical protein